MTPAGSYSKPNIAIPSSQKDEDYHRRWALSILHGSLTDNWANSYQLLAELYRFYQAGSSGELTGFLQKAQDGSDLPAYWTTTNSIRTKVDVLVGEMETRDYEIKAIALNKEAIARKLEEKERLRVERKLGPVLKNAEAKTGLPLQSGEYIPQSDQELDEYMDLSFKDKAELIIEGALRWIAKQRNWDEQRKKVFMDVLIANRGIFRTEIIRGVPVSKRVDPLCFIFDPDSTDDMLSDSTYFGEVEYIPLAQAAERYGLDLRQLNQVYANYENFLGIGQIGAQSVGSAGVDGFGAIQNNRFKWFKKVDNSPRVMVVRTVWKDIKDLNYKYEKKQKEYGEAEFLQKTDKKPDIAKTIECWHQCTIIGGQIVKDWGEVPNQPRSTEDLGLTECPYKVWIPNYYQTHSVSKVEQLVGLQLFKDILMYNMQVEVSTAGGRGVMYDLAFKPDNMTQEQVMAYMKTARIGFFNSKEYQIQGGNTNPVQGFDMSLNNSLNGTIQLMQYVDSEMANISGVSPERQGIVQGASAAVGVTQSALLQSNLITAPYFKGFERLCSRTHNYQAKLVKIAWAGKEKFAPIIGDVGVDFLRDNIDLELDDFDCWIVSQPPLLLDRQKLENIISIAIQSQAIELADALAILIEPDTKTAVRKLQRKLAIRKMLEAQQQQAQQQAEQDQQQQQLQAQAQNQQAALQSAEQLQQMKNDSNREKTLITSRTKLNQAKIDLLKH